MLSLVIFDFDGTLFDTHESILQTIQLTFNALLPDRPPPPSDKIHRLIASGSGLIETFSTLHPSPAEFDDSTQNKWMTQYRALYATDGQPLIKPFPGAEELLTKLKKLNIPVAIVSNKGVTALKTALKNNGMGGYVPDDLIIGDNTPGAKRKPDPSSFTNVLVPALRDNHGVQVEAKDVLVVGDTIADIEFAKNIQSKICWCRYGYGDPEACQALVAEGSVVESLKDALDVINTLNSESEASE